MAEITNDQIKHLARLARIRLSAAEAAHFGKEIKSILKFVERLQRVDTGRLEPTSQVTGLTDITRPDQVKPSRIKQSELFKNAPATRDGYLEVKRVLEGK